MANSNTIQVTLQVKDDGSVVVQGFEQKTKKSMGEIEAETKKSSGGIVSSLQNIKMQWLAIAAATAGAVALIKKTVGAFMEEESAQMKLAVAMKNQGDFTRANYRALLDYASALQKATTYGDETTIAMMANLKTYGMNTEELKRATEATMNLATAKGMDLTAASELVGKAFVGETGTLARYGIIVDSSLKKTEKFDAVLGQIQGRFGGAARAEIETYAGQWKQIANWWGDLAEKVGIGLLKALEAVQFAAGLVAAGFYTVLETIVRGMAWLMGYAEKLPVIGRHFRGFKEELDFIAAGYANAKNSALEFANKNYEMLKSFDRVEKAAEKMAGGVIDNVKKMTEEQIALQKQLTDAIKQLTLSEAEYKIWALNQEVVEMRKVAGENQALQRMISQYRKAALADMVKDFEKAYAQIGKTEYDLARAAAEEQALSWEQAGANRVRVEEWKAAQLKFIYEKENAENIKAVEEFNKKYNELGKTPFDLERAALAEQVEAWRQAGAGKIALAEYEQKMITQINAQEAQTRMQAIKDVAGGMAAGFKDVAEMGGQYSREAFMMYKAFKIVEIAIATKDAAMKAYSAMAGLPYVGPALGVAAAAAAVAFGAAQAAAVASAQPPSYDEGGVSTKPGMYYSGVPEAHIPLKSGAVPVEISGKKEPEKEREIRLDIANIVSPELLDSYLASPRGKAAMLNVIGSNAQTVRRVLRG